jgi:hypothetical protein
MNDPAKTDLAPRERDIVKRAEDGDARIRAHLGAARKVAKSAEPANMEDRSMSLLAHQARDR